MKVVSKGKMHFTKPLPYVCGGGESDRTIMPSRDGGNVGTTVFRCKAGPWCEGIVYTCDETVYVVEGRVAIKFGSDATVVELVAGDHYSVRSGETYALTVVEDCVVFCVFSPVPGGPAVNLEPDPPFDLA